MKKFSKLLEDIDLTRYYKISSEVVLMVLIPLNELVPDKCHPVTGIKIADMLKLCQDTLKVERID